MNIVIGTALLGGLALFLWGRLPDGSARDTALREAIKLGQFILPRMTVALIGASFFAELLPAETVRDLFGTGAGFGGLLLATLLGPVTPGGVFVCFAVAAAGLQVGASKAAVLAYVSAWAVFSLTKVLAYEAPLMGQAFTLKRLALSLPIPFCVAGGAYLLN